MNDEPMFAPGWDRPLRVDLREAMDRLNEATFLVWRGLMERWEQHVDPPEWMAEEFDGITVFLEEMESLMGEDESCDLN